MIIEGYCLENIEEYCLEMFYELERLMIVEEGCSVVHGFSHPTILDY
jgi:hypothetical protein